MSLFQVLVAGAIEDFAKLVDLRCQVYRRVADEEAVIVGDVRVRRGAADDLVVVIFDHVVAQEIAAGDDPIADIGLLKGLEGALAVDMALRIHDHGETEARTLAMLALNDEAVVAGEQFLEMREVLAPLYRHARQLLEIGR